MVSGGRVVHGRAVCDRARDARFAAGGARRAQGGTARGGWAEQATGRRAARHKFASSARAV